MEHLGSQDKFQGDRQCKTLSLLPSSDFKGCRDGNQQFISLFEGLRTARAEATET